MKWSLDDIPAFIAVVEQHGITAAANVLRRPKSTISTAISRLETGLGLRLIERNSRTQRVTPEGERFYRQALLIMDQVREADATAAGMKAEPSGRLSAAVPPAYCQEIIAPNLADFRARYPRIDLDLLVTTSGVGLLRDRVDVAVAVGPLEDSEMVSRTLISGPLVWVCSADYARAHRFGNGIEDLRPHIQIVEKRYGNPRQLVHINGTPHSIDLEHGVHHVTTPLVVRGAVMQGAGIGLMPLHYCGAQLAQGALIEVFKHITFDSSASTLTLVYPSRRHVSPRLRAFIDFLIETGRSR